MSSLRHGGKYLIYPGLAALPPVLGGLAFLAASRYRSPRPVGSLLACLSTNSDRRT
jgi:hypothetical protein